MTLVEFLYLLIAFASGFYFGYLYCRSISREAMRQVEQAYREVRR